MLHWTTASVYKSVAHKSGGQADSDLSVLDTWTYKAMIAGIKNRGASTKSIETKFLYCKIILNAIHNGCEGDNNESRD